MRSKEKHQKRLNKKNGHDKPIQTFIGKAKPWTNAEDYHQKYYLRKHATLIEALGCKTEEELRESHVAARLNGCVAGNSNIEQLEREIESYGLNDDAKEYLTNIVKSKKRGFFCAG